MDIAEQLRAAMPTELTGSVARTVGMTVSAADFPARFGAKPVSLIQNPMQPPMNADERR